MRWTAVTAPIATEEPVSSLEQRVGELIGQAQAGNRAAFKDLYQLHAARVFRACQALLGDANLAEDATQQVFTAAFKSIGKFEGRSSFSTWLHGFAVRIAANLRRGRSRRKRALDALSQHEPAPLNHSPSPEEVVSEKEFVGQLDRALERLPDNKRSAFLLYHVLELRLTEVARAMGASRQTTLARLKAARRELVDMLVVDSALDGGSR